MKALLATLVLSFLAFGCDRDKKYYVTNTSSTSNVEIIEIDLDYVDIECPCNKKFHVHRHGHAGCAHGNQD